MVTTGERIALACFAGMGLCLRCLTGGLKKAIAGTPLQRSDGGRRTLQSALMQRTIRVETTIDVRHH
jgi:hypothetical protein